MWDGIISSLAATRPVIRFEYPGHGGQPPSDVPIVMDDLVDQLFDVMDKSGVERAHLAGISIGGMIAIRAAVLRPDRVASLAVICSSPRLPVRTWLDRARTVRENGLAALSDFVANRWFTESFRLSYPEVVERHLRMLRTTDPEGYAQTCELLARTDLRNDLGRVDAPALVIAGSEDFATPLADVRYIASGIRDARLEILDGVSHMAVAAAGARIAKAITVHVSSHLSGP